MKKRYLLTTSIIIDVEVDHPNQGPEDDQTFEQASFEFSQAVAQVAQRFPGMSYSRVSTITELGSASNLHQCPRCGCEFTAGEEPLPGLPLGWQTEEGLMCDQCVTWKNWDPPSE